MDGSKERTTMPGQRTAPAPWGGRGGSRRRALEVAAALLDGGAFEYGDSGSFFRRGYGGRQAGDATAGDYHVE